MPRETPDPEMVDGLVQLSFLVQSILVRSAAQHDLTVPQVRLLGILRDREPGMMELAAHLGLDKSSVTGLIDRAQRRGLVRRRSTPADGRAVLVSCTPEGRRLIDEVGPTIVAAVHSLGSALNAAERLMLTELIRRVVSASPAASTSHPDLPRDSAVGHPGNGPQLQ